MAERNLKLLSYGCKVCKQKNPKASSLCRTAIFVHWTLHILLFITSHFSLLFLCLVSLCLRSPWLINSGVPSYFACGDRLSHRCRFPRYRTLLVTNTDSLPGTGSKSQLEKSEIQPLKLPSEDYQKLLQLSPSPFSLSHFYALLLPQPLFPVCLNTRHLTAVNTASVCSGAVACWRPYNRAAINQC